MQPYEIEDIEIQLLLQALRMRYGYDFSSYSRSSLHRRIRHCLSLCDFNHISEIIPPLLHEGLFLNRLISTLTVTVSSMFRDPKVFKAIREQVIPVLKTHPFINIWHAGCATGEEVYSMAILLREAGLYDRTHLYATDMNADSLQKAAEGIFPAEKFKEFSDHYKQAGGVHNLLDYGFIHGTVLKMNAALRKNMIFANHNLVSDHVFGEMHLILCRNVLIYFDLVLQEKVIQLFNDSLVRGGFLCLGQSETLQFTKLHNQFLHVDKKHKICRKIMSIN